ncbi:MAG: glycoside hydrolase family 9 protein [Bacteroidales bacterium]|nr:glycoside hydrolase family 9 protein [Bacteroidales bacterium]
MSKMLITIVLSLVITTTLSATKFISVRALDKDYIVIFFKDGEVFYRDNGFGTSAYTGHDYAPGDDSLAIYGKELDTKIATLLSSWTIYSNNDSFYGQSGKKPLAIYRKSKTNNTDHKWDYKLDHWIFIKLPTSLKQGANYTIKIAGETNADRTEAEFNFDIFNNMSEAVHTNILGYHPESPVKAADLYYWMGDGGARDYKSFEDKNVWIYNVTTKRKYKGGKVKFWKKSAHEAENRNLTGSDVWNIDFSNFRIPGIYRLVVDGVGCSADFKIDKDIMFEPYRYSVIGYYYMRIGEDQMGMVPVPRRPLFIPEKDPNGFTVYITDLQPFNPVWKTHKGDTWDEPHYKPAKESLFWQHRLPGSPTNPNAFGGHSDALDWDRHLGHVSNIYDLLLPYFLSNGKLKEDNLGIAESGNGIPDIIDEARNEVDFWLRLRHGEAYAHGLTNPSTERTIMFQAGTTTIAAWANAANCAMLGDCFRISGNFELMNYYRDEAIKAFEFATKQTVNQLDDIQDIGDAAMRGRDFKMMAAAFLYNISGDKKWEQIIAEESVVKTGKSYIQKGKEYSQIWATVAYLLSPRERNFPALYKNMKESVRFQAFDDNTKYMDIRPSRRSSNNNWWQTAENLHLVIIAHAISNDTKEKEVLEKAMVLESSWGLGRNPSNIVEMTGLGSRNVVNCFTSGRNDGTPGLHPGHTPYNNLGVWDTNNNGGNPQWFVEKCYPNWIKGGWPHQEGHFNCRYSWSNGEFTPQQTMRGKMALYGYLHGLYIK